MCEEEFESDNTTRKKIYCSYKCYQRKRNIWAKYRLTPKQYNILVYNGKCSICGISPEFEHQLHIDHCHLTGKVRGILCYQCNTGLAKFREDPDLLRKAAFWIESGGNAEQLIADPNDSGMLDIVGFDSSVPNLLTDFATAS